MIDEPSEPILVTITREQSPRDMRQVTLAAIAGGPRDLVLDLRAAAVGDLEVALLLGLRARQRARRRELTLVCGAESSTREALSRSGLSAQFTTVTGLPCASRVVVTTKPEQSHRRSVGTDGKVLATRRDARSSSGREGLTDRASRASGGR